MDSMTSQTPASCPSFPRIPSGCLVPGPGGPQFLHRCMSCYPESVGLGQPWKPRDRGEGRKAGRDPGSLCSVSLGSGNEMPFNFIVRFSFLLSITLSGARRPLATGCVFNKSDKVFIWLAACSLELGWPGRHCFPQASVPGVGWGGVGRDDAWDTVLRPECWSQLCHPLSF